MGGGHDSSIVVGVGVGSAEVTAAGEVGEKVGGVGKLAQMVVNEFRNPWVSGIYILSMLILGAHLYHAISSAMTSLGGNHPRYQKLIMWTGNIFTAAITFGFLAIPLWFVLGLPANGDSSAKVAEQSRQPTTLGSARRAAKIHRGNWRLIVSDFEAHL